MAFVFWLLAALVPCLIGMGALRVLYRGQALREMTLADSILTGVMICIGLAEAAHLGAVVLGWSFSRCVLLFGVATGAVALLAIGVLVLSMLFDRKKSKAVKRIQPGMLGKKGDFSACLPIGIFALLVLGQLAMIWKGRAVYVDGDLTLETVVSFLERDALYEINPMTGRPYVLGIPSRLKILCLPSLYGALCSMFALEPATLVIKMIPVLILLGSYLAYYTLAKYFFPEDAWKRGVFLGITALLLGVGDYLYGMDGFGLLHSGFRGVTIRGAVLLPYLFSLLLRRKYKLVPLCILAEACIVWTLYGAGACVAVTAGMLAVRGGYRHLMSRMSSGSWENSGTDRADGTESAGETGKEADHVGTPE